MSSQYSILYSFLSQFLPRRVTYDTGIGSVDVKGQIQTQKYGSIKSVFGILVHDANLFSKSPNFVFKTRIRPSLAQMFYTSSEMIINLTSAH